MAQGMLFGCYVYARLILVLLGRSNQGPGYSLRSLWTVAARQASLPGQLVSPFTGPLCYFFFSVKVMYLVLLGLYNVR